MKHRTFPHPVLWLSAAILAVCAVHTGDASAANRVAPLLVRADDPGEPKTRTYFVGTGASIEEAVALRDRLIEAGARNVNLVVPDMVIVCDLPARAAGRVDLPAPFSTQSAAMAAVSSGGAAWGWIVDAYRTVDDMQAAAAAGVDVPGLPGAPGETFDDVVLTVSPERADAIAREVDKSRALRGAPRPELARNTMQNSEFVGGSILANFILPESDGTKGEESENWSDADVISAKQGAVEAMISWQAAWPKMDINFVLNFGFQDAFVRVPCGYEPIKFTMQSDEVWILETMRALGYALHTSDQLVAVHEFNEEQRALYRTQWVYTAFIACSRNTPSHRFGGGTANYTAYAYLGGPFMVEPFPAGTDPNNVGERLVYSQIVNHEAAHNFWTLDEYPNSPGVCAATSGYLNYSNGNQTMTDPGGNEARCNPLRECIMHTAARKAINPRPWCWWSQGHLGVIDNNDNGMPDIFEMAPEIVFAVQGPETVTTNQYTLRFKAISRAVPNRNVHLSPEARIDYAAPLKRGWISVGGQSVVLIEPLDGRWDELEEDCEFRLSVAQVGQSVISVQVENSVGYESPTTPKVIYFTGVNYARTSLTPRPSRMDVAWQIGADPFGAKFNVYRLESGEPLPGKLLAQNIPPQGPPVNGFTPYRYIDREVVAGRDYRYYVEGVFTLPFEGGTKQYNSPSQVMGQTAMLPIDAGGVISNVAPNPSPGAVTFSVNVPRTYGGPERAPLRLATPVEIGIYNVRGQLVRALRDGGELNDVLTVRWDGTDDRNLPAPSGVYFVRATAGTTHGMRKIVLVR